MEFGSVWLLLSTSHQTLQAKLFSCSLIHTQLHDCSYPSKGQHLHVLDLLYLTLGGIKHTFNLPQHLEVRKSRDCK